MLNAHDPWRETAAKALQTAVDAFSAFDHSVPAWRRVIAAESECRKALDELERKVGEYRPVQLDHNVGRSGK